MSKTLELISQQSVITSIKTGIGTKRVKMNKHISQHNTLNSTQIDIKVLRFLLNKLIN